MKVAINKNKGMMFDLSHEAVLMYFGLRGQKIYLEQLTDVDSDGYIYWLQPEKKGRLRSSFSAYDLERNDLNLIKTIETLGEKANTEFSKLKIVEIPSGCNWEVDDFDGDEWINISLKIS